MTKLQNFDYIINADSTLSDAMVKITVNHRGCVVVVDNDMLVVGVLSDGDIRRAMVKGATTFTPVEKAMNPNFVSVSSGDNIDADKFFEDHKNINIVPVIDDKNKLVDVIARGGMYSG